jgi:hypothetical protein
MFVSSKMRVRRSVKIVATNSRLLSFLDLCVSLFYPSRVQCVGLRGVIPETEPNRLNLQVRERRRLGYRITEIIFAAVLMATVAFPQSGQSNPSQPAEKDDFNARLSAFRKQGSDALARERARTRQQPCTNAKAAGNAEMTRCLEDQLKTAERDYLQYAQAVGQLLRLQFGDQSTPATRPLIKFDPAEEAWHSYRENTCASTATQWQGSESEVANAECRLRLTSAHMNELADVYSSLWR